VTRGVKFAIYTPVAEIVDPETNESLGTYRERKATVEAQIVADKFTIAETPTKYAWNLDPLAALGESVSAQSKLPVKEADIEPLPTGSTVRVGDVAERVRPPTPPKPAPTTETTTE
jgi:hypothetical protein